MLMFPRNPIKTPVCSLYAYSTYGVCRADSEATCPTERLICVRGLVLGCLQCMAAEALVTAKTQIGLHCSLAWASSEPQ